MATEEWFSSDRWLAAPKQIVSAAVVATDDQDRLLLVRSPWRGWEMPGGQLEQGEDIFAGAVRETEEESGIIMTDIVFRGMVHVASRAILNLLFTGRPVGGELRTSSESVEVGFYPVADALNMVTHGDFRERIERCLDPDNQPFVLVR